MVSFVASEINARPGGKEPAERKWNTALTTVTIARSGPAEKCRKNWISRIEVGYLAWEVPRTVRPGRDFGGLDCQTAGAPLIPGKPLPAAADSRSTPIPVKPKSRAMSGLAMLKMAYGKYSMVGTPSTPLM